jgi:hypothetical protein
VVTGYGRELRSSHCHKEEGLLISLVSDPWASPRPFFGWDRDGGPHAYLGSYQSVPQLWFRVA